MIEQLVSNVFAARNAAHLAHWKTGSRSEHLATAAFYDESIKLIDRAVECYQGAFEKVSKVKLADIDKDLVEMLSEQAVWIGENLDDISRNLAPLENILAELMELYLSTLYQLNNLR